MFDSFDLGNGFYDAGPSTIGGSDYGITDVGQWSPTWDVGMDANQGSAWDTGGGALEPLFANMSAGSGDASMGFNTDGLGKWAQGAGDVTGADTDAAKLDAKMAQLAKASDNQSPLAKIFNMKTGEDGSIDWSDGKNLTKVLQALGAGGNFLTKLLQRGKQTNAQTAAQLQRGLPQNPYDRWTPAQQQWANQFFNTPYTAPAQRATVRADQLASPIVAGRGYAEGGDVEGGAPLSDPQMLGLVRSDTSGQADDVPASLNGEPNALALSGGEYVWDADVVSALGDGNNEAGAKKLDELRMRIREQNRSAPSNKIPPLSMGVDEMAGMLGGEGEK